METVGSIRSKREAATAGQEHLSAREVSVRFGGLSVLANVSLSVARNEILGLIGPNGAGKTTFVNCLTGFQRPTTGGVILEGRDTTGWTAERLRSEGVARTFQAGRLFKEMSVLENAEVTGLGLGLNRAQARAKGLELLDWIGIADKAWLPAGALSYTDQRRLSIARALTVSPLYVLLDEPAAGMSDVEADELIVHIGAIPKQFGCGVLLIEHNMHVVMGISDRVHVLDGGMTIAEGTPLEIKNNQAVLSAYLGMDAS